MCDEVELTVSIDIEAMRKHVVKFLYSELEFQRDYILEPQYPEGPTKEELSEIIYALEVVLSKVYHMKEL